MHLADIVANWNINKRGICNRWSRLFLMAFILGSDTYLVLNSPSETTSYTAHAGGLVYGYLCGIVFLDNLENTYFHRYFGKPAALLAAVLFPVLGALYYWFGVFPPDPLYRRDGYAHDPCCWQLLQCGLEDNGDGSFDDTFYCKSHVVHSYAGRQELNSCSEFEAAFEAKGY